MPSVKSLIEQSNGGDINLPLFALPAAKIIAAIADDPKILGASLDTRREDDKHYVIGAIAHIARKQLNISINHPLVKYLHDVINSYGLDAFKTTDFCTMFLTETSQMLGEFHQLLETTMQLPLNPKLRMYDARAEHLSA